MRFMEWERFMHVLRKVYRKSGGEVAKGYISKWCMMLLTMKEICVTVSRVAGNLQLGIIIRKSEK